MNEETRASEPATVGAVDLSRRSVVRSATRAAWAVPVISTVAAAPAFAANSDTLAFSGSPLWNGKSELNVVFTVLNDSPNDPAQGLVATLTYAPTSQATVTLPTAGAWTLASVNGGTVTLTCPNVAAGTPSQFTLRISYGNNGTKTVTISGSVTTTSDFASKTVSLTPNISSPN